MCDDFVLDGLLCVIVVVSCDICYGCDSCVSGDILCLWELVCW